MFSSHSKIDFHRWTLLVIFTFTLSFTACKKDCICPDDYPSLKVVNQLEDNWRRITNVSLVGYQFSNLNIEPFGDSQTFVLDKGMSGGFENIYVKVTYLRYSSVYGFADIKVDFKKGGTTTIVLKGCDIAEGCPGIYLEYVP